MWVWAASMAFGQDTVLWDFDLAEPPAPGALAGTTWVGAPSLPWDGLALGVLPVPVSSQNVLGYVLLAGGGDGAAIVTHAALTVRATTDDPAGPKDLLLTVADAEDQWVADAMGTASAGSWSAWTVTGLEAVCGGSARLDLLVQGAGAPGADWTTWVDDFVFTGAVCPEFVDGDGDGACPQGRDLDGDGTCLAADEVLPPGAPADCDDGRYGPACLALTVGPPSGGVIQITVTGALAGETVELLGSVRAGQTCPARLGGACIDLSGPRRIGALVADSAGIAQGSFVLPSPPLEAAPGHLRVQALVVRPGPADVSAVVLLAP